MTFRSFFILLPRIIISIPLYKYYLIGSTIWFKSCFSTEKEFYCWLVPMALKGKGSIYQHVKGKMYVYIPAIVRDDSTFPFKPGEKVSVIIDNDKLVVEKEKK